MLGAREESVCQIRVARQVDRLAAERWGGHKPTVMIGRDARLVEALDKVARFAASDGPVLINGETGTGKELFARALFLLSERKHRQFLSINCAQYHDGQLIASELFGHRRGAFTGAIADHRGMFEEADGGVIFLDEVGELSPPAQAMLLRVLGEGEIVPVGATQPKRIDVRVIAATSRDLVPMVESGAFRPDLYYRLRCLHVVVPPVRSRGDDWELIASYYLDRLRTRRGWDKRLSADARALMGNYDWPGNVREVKSVIDTGFHLSDGEFIEPRDFVEQLETMTRREQLRNVIVARETGSSLKRPSKDGKRRHLLGRRSRTLSGSRVESRGSAAHCRAGIVQDARQLQAPARALQHSANRVPEVHGLPAAPTAETGRGVTDTRRGDRTSVVGVGLAGASASCHGIRTRATAPPAGTDESSRLAD